MAFQDQTKLSKLVHYEGDAGHDNEALSEDESLSETDHSASVDSDSYDPEWVDEITENGDLFYVGSSLPVHCQSPLNDTACVDATRKLSVENINKNIEVASKRTGKLKALVRSTKAIKNGDLGPREVPGAEDTGSLQMTKTSTQEQNSQVKEVFLDVVPGRHNYGRRATLCEALFGIIPGHGDNGRNFFKSSSSLNLDVTREDEHITVIGLIPDGEAMRSEAIKIGDRLQYINDMEVNFNNLNQILNSITSPSKIKLTFQRFPIPVVNDESRFSSQNVTKTKLAKLITRNDNKENGSSPSLTDVPHVVLFLTTEGVSEQGTGKEDIVYCFPDFDNKVVQIRGLFITIGHTLADIVVSYPISSTLIIDGKLIHVGYAHEGSEVFAIALPEECISLNHLHQLTKDIVRLLCLQYHSLLEAFSQKANKNALDHLFTIILQQLITQQSGKLLPNNRCRFGSFQDNELSAHTLPLPNETRIEIHNLISEFESSEFVDMSDDFYDAQRSYSILGSCLFYRGYLIANHLPKEDMLDIFTYMKYHGLLILTHLESISRIIIWKEVFPTRRRAASSDSDLSEAVGRWFLLIIGLKRYLFGTILEAGGYSAKAEGNPGPDSCYINQAEATLLQLESLQISSACENSLSGQVPALANIDWFIQSGRTSKDDVTFMAKDLSPSNPHNLKSVTVNMKRSQTELTSILKKKSNAKRLSGSNPVLCDNESDTSHSMGTSATSSMSDENIPVVLHREPSWLQGRTSSSDAESRGSSNSALYKSEKKNRMFPSGSSLDLNSLDKALTDPETLPVKLTAGLENILFHYLQLDSVNGVFISATEQSSGSMLSTELMDNFQEACILIHNVFQETIAHKENNNESRHAAPDLPLGFVKEHGILFQCSLPTRPNQKKPSPTVSYWVVGRLFWDVGPQEVYVCFLDSIPQNIIELAFKLGFGATL